MTKTVKSTVPQDATRRGETMKPNAVFKLIDTVGASRAARLLGVSTTTLQTARHKGEISKVIEIAAAGLLRDIVTAGGSSAARQPVATAVFLLEVREDQVPAVEMFAKAFQATLVSA